MAKILFIVESPGKIKKINSILGTNYKVLASYGHFRDLDSKKMSINFEENFEPIYVITKSDVVKQLKSAMKGIDMVYIASDEDREGEAIAQSIYDTLHPKNYKRLRFNSITKEAILAAIKNGGMIDEKLVNAQKARRVLDRLFGYLISPLLQKQIGGVLSSGRVQSPTVKLVIDKEDEIQEFLKKNENSSHFKVHGTFSSLKSTLHESTDKNPSDKKAKEPFKGDVAKIPLVKEPDPNAKVILFLKRCLKSTFKVHSVSERTALRTPSPPFTTSTLQQEAFRKMGMSIDNTMKNAQKLYEGGYITYMRTDSVEISAEGHQEIKKVIEEEYGKEYYQKNIYKAKSKNTQEAHEAIRPVHPELKSLEKEINDQYQIKLYKLIWQRTIASQMKPAKIKVTTIQITISKFVDEKIEPFYYFQSQIEKIIFAGFMKVYVESLDEPEENGITRDFAGKIPKEGAKVIMEEIVAKQEFLKPPPRYTQASLVKKLEELGIGRPSTFVNTIKTILTREYIKNTDVPGIKKDITTYFIKSENKKPIMTIFEESGQILLGKENNKLIPTPLGRIVIDYLIKNFPEMMDYKFTAKMETELDDIAEGKKIWYKVVKQFYDKLEPIVSKLSKEKSIKASSEKLLGKDKDGHEIYASVTKFGPVVKKKLGKKFVYSKIKEPLTLETITLEDALKLFEYPKILGQYEKNDVLLQKGEYGLYIVYQGENYSVSKDVNENEIDLEKAIEIIKEKKSLQLAEFTVKENGKTIKATVFAGKIGLGPFIQIKRGNKKFNYALPKDLDPKDLTEEKVLEIISKKKTFFKKGGRNKKKYQSTAKKSNNKKTYNKTNSKTTKKN